MRTKTLALGWVVAGLFLGSVGLASAQMVGLPVMDTATPRDQGNLELLPGVVVGQDMNFYGARTTLSVLDEFRIFVDVGQVDIREGDANFAVQGGMLYTLMSNDFIDLGVRGAGYSANTDLLGLTGCNGMVVFSDETVLTHLFCHGGIGLDYVHKSIETRWGASSKQNEINPALSLGLSYQFNENFTLFTEANYVDGLYAGIGLSIR
ncbi:MAG: hypothetical protein WCS52_16220 [bacterium]